MSKIVKVAIIVLFLALSFFVGFMIARWREKILSPEKVGKNALEFIKNNLVRPGTEVQLKEVSKESGMYKMKIEVAGQPFELFVTKDGKYLFLGSPIDITQKPTPPPQAKEPEKRERPDIKLFVMSYCPYGLQMQKALLPVWQLLKDKADIGVYFVDYIMHGKAEMEENLRQYCIQKEQKEKYLTYLECFAKNGSYENSEIYKNCLKEAKIDENKLDSCTKETDKAFKITELYNDKNSWLNGTYPPFNIYKDLNEKYGVQGSPTLVINDTVSEVQRSPEKVKEAICKAFTNPPAECQQKLSEEETSPGFGMATGSSSSGSCQ
jgi:protein-disulfide isomerase